MAGECGKVMTFVRNGNYSCDIRSADVSKIANQTKYVPDEFIVESADHVTDACCEYLLPLIAGECDVLYNNGLPAHIIL